MATTLYFYLKVSSHYFKSFENRAINFLGSNVGLLDIKDQLPSKNGIHGIDFVAAIKQIPNLFLILLKSK